MTISNTSPARQRVGVFGGTFDPVHNGHLQIAAEVKQELELDDMRLLPSRLPPHRDLPGASTEQRLAMLELAVGDWPELSLDLRELDREGPSYMVDTLEDMRRELGPEVSISLVVGADAFAGLMGWHRWRDLIKLAHLVVVARPGYALPAAGDSQFDVWVRAHLCPHSAIAKASAGGLVVLELSLLDISATVIRQRLAESAAGAEKSLSVDALPPAVLDYIRAQHLYQR